MKKDKELLKIEQKIAQENKIKEAFAAMDSFIAECDAKIDKLVQNARKARDNQGVKLARIGIAGAIAAKNRAEKMRLSMDTLMTMSEISKMTAGFLGNMEVLCKELNSVAKSTSFSKIDKPLGEALRSFEMQSDKLEEIFDNLSSSFDDVDINLDSVSSEQIDRLISSDPFVDEISLDIDKRLEKLKNESKT